MPPRTSSPEDKAAVKKDVAATQHCQSTVSDPAHRFVRPMDTANFPGHAPVPGYTAQDHEKIRAREAIAGRLTAACFSLPDMPRLLRLRNFSIRAGEISRKFGPRGGGGRLGQGQGHPQGLG